MGNTGLLRRKAEMNLLQPHLGEMRRQELRNSPFWHSSLFKSQLVKEGEDFLLKKDSQGFGPYQNKPFRCPHNKKRGSNRKRPYGGNSSQSSNQSFSSGRGKLYFLLKKGTSKTLRVSDPIKTSPFVVPTTRKEAPTGNAPMGATPHKAVTNRFLQVGETELFLDAFLTPL